MISTTLSRFLLLGDLSSIKHLLSNVLQFEDNPIFKMIVPIATILATIWALWHQVYPFLESFMVNARITQSELLYDDLIRWMEHHTSFFSFDARGESQSDHHGPRRVQTSKYEIAATVFYRYPAPTSNVPTEYMSDVNIHLTPSKGSQFIWFNKTLMHLRLIPMGPTDPGKAISIHCMSRSTAPLRAFLEEVRAFSKKQFTSYVTVYRISISRDSPHWARVTSRPARDISTVILAKDIKDALIKDIKDWLSPRSCKWYSNHGIGYRRGYLLSGPPGTGKSSLAGAIAGMFGLDIYILSLNDPEITENQLVYLLSKVPSYSVVLVEDVDAATVAFSRSQAASNVSQTNRITGDARQFHAPVQPVSLSTLLNAIDGVASHEGRILVMTTNYPETLDDALIRPGRVDLHLRFELPGREEFRELFRSIYTGLEEFEEEKSVERDIDGLSLRFADQLPENRFSVADVQGFLLLYKLHPEEACEKVAEWVHQHTQVKGKDTSEDNSLTVGNQQGGPTAKKGLEDKSLENVHQAINGYS